MPVYSALDIVTRALSTIGVIESEEQPTAAQAEDALASLNDLLNSWDALGIGGGYSDATLSTELTLDPDEYRAVRLMLAVDLSADYQAQIAPALVQLADDARRVLDAKYCRPRRLCANESDANAC